MPAVTVDDLTTLSRLPVPGLGDTVRAMRAAMDRGRKIIEDLAIEGSGKETDRA